MGKRTVETEVKANVSDYVAGTKKAADATDDLADSQNRASESTDQLGKKAASQTESWKTVSTNLVVAGGAAAAFGLALPVKAASDFESAMAQVSATGPDAKARLSELAVAARESSTDIEGAGFSAVEAAGGIEALIKAGVSVDDVMGGAMSGALTLAAAGEMDVADAAEVASGAMTQFKLSGKDVPHIADLLAAGAGKAQGDVSDLAYALQQSGLVASQFGLSIEETVGTLSAFASNALLGSDAGTSMRTMLLRLANPSGEAAEEMARLGINAYDASGNFVGLTALAGQLQDGLGGLEQAERDAAMATIFGSDAIRAANVLYEQGTEGMQEWTAAVDDAGYAQEVASDRLNSLNGDLQKLWAVVTEIAIGTGEVSKGPLRDFVTGLTDLLRVAADNPEQLQVVAVGIGLLGAAVAGVGITMKIVTAVSEFRIALSKLDAASRKAADGTDKANVSAGRLSRTLKGVAGIAAAGGLLVFLGNLRNSLLATASGADEANTAMQRFAEGTGNIDNVFLRQDGAGIWESSSGDVNDLASALQVLADGTPKWTNKYKAVAEQFGLIDQALTNMDSEQAGAAFSQLRDEADRLGIPMSNLLPLLDDYVAKADAMAASNGQGELSYQQLIAMLTAGIPDVEDAADALAQTSEYADGLAQSEEAAAAQAEALAEKLASWAEGDAGFVDLMDGWNAVIEKNKEVAQTAADASKDTGDSWEDFYDGHTVALEDYLAELEAQVTAQENWETNMVALAGKVSQGTLDYLAQLGPEGAPLVAELVDASDEELGRLEDVFAQQSEDATGAFAEELDRADDVWAALLETAGSDAVEAAKKEFLAGKTTLEDIVDDYDLEAVLNVDTSRAVRDVNNTLNSINGRTVTAYVAIKTYGQGAVAIGGYGADVASAIGLRNGGQAWRRYEGLLEGPGTTTSDSIHAMLSRKEFVTNADATDYYGTRVMYAMNAKAIPRAYFEAIGFAGGGSAAVATPAYPPAPSLSLGSLSASVDSGVIATAIAAELRKVRIVDSSGRTNDQMQVVLDGLGRL